MVLLNTINISPPLLNSSCAWSSDFQQLTDLYESPYTGAITTRTATLDGFQEDISHVVAFAAQTITTINSYGYSPHPLSSYLSWIATILTSHAASSKPVIISITASDPAKLKLMLDFIQDLRTKLLDKQISVRKSRVAIELNTSCPNIPNAPPSGYSFKSLLPLLQVLVNEYTNDPSLTIGLKLPPYVYKEQFTAVFVALKSLAVTNELNVEKTSPIAFLTCTNTLGNSLLFSSQLQPTPDGEINSFAVPTALGGLAGEALHPLALGNVFSFKQLLASHEASDAGLGNVKIIGVGGVTSKEAAERMRNAGADFVACATLFGREGIRAFEILGKE